MLDELVLLEHFHMTSQRPYWCSKPILLKLKLFSYVKAHIDAGHESENAAIQALIFQPSENNRARNKLYFVLYRILK